jgi:hypothetical protein
MEKSVRQGSRLNHRPGSASLRPGQVEDKKGPEDFIKEIQYWFDIIEFRLDNNEISCNISVENKKRE